MDAKWKSPNTIIGSVAKGKFFFKRDNIIRDIWKEIEKGNYVLIAAPRRVGKSSVMQNMEENPKDGYKLIFRNIQSVDSEKNFYKIMYELILNCLNTSQKIGSWFSTYKSKIGITGISTTGINIENKEIKYKNEIDEVINKLKDEGETVVLLIDELPEVLFRLYKNGKQEEAISILKNLRQWRQNADSQKLRFVLAGSIGIHYVVKLIEGRTSDLNDLKLIDCNPLLATEIDTYFDWTTGEATVQYNSELRKYLTSKIQYFVPYFFNIMLEEIDKIAFNCQIPEITIETIDKAFENVIKNNDHFKDWKNRLKDYLPIEDFKFINEILKHISHNDKITIQQVYDKSIEYGKEDDFMEFMSDLQHDGYIIQIETEFRFISPFLKEFWKRNNPIL